MDPITAGIVSGGVGLAGTMMQNSQAASNAQSQMDFQQYMASTSHQREVSDLRAAGLNPILSALGSGAPAPGGAMAPVADLGNSISKGMDTAIAVRQQNKDLQQKDVQIDNTTADTSNKSATADLIRQQTAATAKEVQSKNLQNMLLMKTMDSQIAKAKAEGDYSQLNQVMGLLGTGASAAGNLMGAGGLFNLLLGKGKK